MIGVVIAMQSEADILIEEMQINRSLTVSGKKVHVGTAYGKEIALCVCGVTTDGVDASQIHLFC